MPILQHVYPHNILRRAKKAIHFYNSIHYLCAAGNLLDSSQHCSINYLSGRGLTPKMTQDSLMAVAETV